MPWDEQHKLSATYHSKHCCHTGAGGEEAGKEAQKNFLWQYWEASRSLHWFRRSLEHSLSREKVQRQKPHWVHERIKTPPKYRMWGSDYDFAGSASSKPKARGQPSLELSSPTGLENHFQSSSLQRGSEVWGKLKPSIRQAPLPKWMVLMPLDFLQIHIQEFCVLPSRAVCSQSQNTLSYSENCLWYQIGRGKTSPWKTPIFQVTCVTLLTPFIDYLLQTPSHYMADFKGGWRGNDICNIQNSEDATSCTPSRKE